MVHISSFAEFRILTMKVMRVIKETHNIEMKGGQTSHQKKSEEMSMMIQGQSR